MDNFNTWNIRTNRGPEFPWEVEGEGLKATVTTTKLERGFAPNDWRNEITLQGPPPWRILQVKTNNPIVSKLSFSTDPEPGDLPKKISFEMTPPRECPGNSREPVTLEVQYEWIDEHRQYRSRTELLNVDYSCLTGDLIPETEYTNAKGLAALAEKYKQDPLIRKLVHRALSLPRLSLKEEVARLKQWAHYQYASDGEGSLLHNGVSWAANIYSPSETVRMGGDCEDWAILAGAYLASLGYRTTIAANISHAWTEVWEKDIDPIKGWRAVTVDLTASEAGKSWEDIQYEHPQEAWGRAWVPEDK